MDNVVVIGGSGFLGSHVADELSVRGYKVKVFDQKPSPWIRNDQTFIEGNILDRSALAAAVDDARFVYHFGGVADINESLTDPYRTLEVNILGTANALEALEGSSVERFVYASTMYVYSEVGSFYRASKQSAEAIIEAYCEVKELDYTFLRYGSLYGPRAQEWNGLRGYVRQVIEKGRLDYPGSGDERREYIHVKDAARLSVDVLDLRHRNQAITVTGVQILNSRDLAEMIFEIAGKTPNVSFLDNSRRQEHYRITPYRYSPNRARKLVPSEFVDLGQGILEICEEFNLESDPD
jgi:UDP-glucose 4-epimerase|tara:strand:+ start:4670 stop:5551 length:882 start_codon:yes stop_codon:yes gene_type:complete